LHDYRAVGAPAANRGIAYLVARGAISNGQSAASTTLLRYSRRIDWPNLPRSRS